MLGNVFGLCIWKTSKTDKRRGRGSVGYIYYILYEGFILYRKDLSRTVGTYVRRAAKAP